MLPLHPYPHFLSRQMLRQDNLRERNRWKTCESCSQVLKETKMREVRSDKRQWTHKGAIVSKEKRKVLKESRGGVEKIKMRGTSAHFQRKLGEWETAPRCGYWEIRGSLREDVEWRRGRMLTVMRTPEQGYGAAALSPGHFSRPGVSDKQRVVAVFPKRSSLVNLR